MGLIRLLSPRVSETQGINQQNVIAVETHFKSFFAKNGIELTGRGFDLVACKSGGWK